MGTLARRPRPRLAPRWTARGQLVTRDRALAEDVVQAAFIRAYERIGQFATARPFGPWFLRSVVNAAVQATARESRWKVGAREPEVQAAALLAALQDPGPGPEAWDQTGQWQPDADAGLLSWEEDGFTFVLTHSGLHLSREDVLRIAESLR